MMRTRCASRLALSALALFGSMAAWAAEDLSRFAGAWLVEVEGATRHRVLHISEVRAGSGAAQLSAKYGWVDAQAAAVNATLVREGSDLVLLVQTPANSQIRATSEDGQRFAGLFTPASGAAARLSVTRIDPDEIERIAPGKPTWDTRIAAVRPGANDVIWIIAHSAADCDKCRRWNAWWVERWTKSNPGVRLAVIERSFISQEETRSMYPDELVHFYEQRKAANHLRSAVPSFELAIGQKVIYRAAGLSSWERDVFPALKALVSRRQQ